MSVDRRIWGAASFVLLAVVVLSFLAVERRTDWPNPDAPSYVQLAENVAAGDGYRVDIEGEPEGSRYPPGFPFLLVLSSPVAGASVATVLLAGAFVVAVWCSAWKAGGPIAASVAVALIAYGFLSHKFAGAVMADVSGALMVVLALLALQHGRPWLAGLLAGFAVWVKLALVPIGLGLPRRSVAPFVAMLAGLAATKLAWSWGYESGQASWAVEHIWSRGGLASPQDEAYPNVVAYPLMLLGLTGGLTLPGAIVLAGWAVWRRPERRFVLAVVVGALAAHVAYFYQDARFMFSAVALVAIYAGVGVAAVVERRRDEDAVESGGAAVVDGDPARATR